VVLLAAFSSTKLVIATIGVLAAASFALTWKVYRQGRFTRRGNHLLDGTGKMNPPSEHAAQLRTARWSPAESLWLPSQL
jgi:hypothetical protein